MSEARSIPEAELQQFKKDEMTRWPPGELEKRVDLSGTRVVDGVVYGLPAPPESEVHTTTETLRAKQSTDLVDESGCKVHPDYALLKKHGIAVLPGRGGYYERGENGTVDIIACEAQLAPRGVIADFLLVLIHRKDDQLRRLALPGGFIDKADRQRAIPAAKPAAYIAGMRELGEETGLYITEPAQEYGPHMLPISRRICRRTGVLGWPTSQGIGIYPTREYWENMTPCAGDDALDVAVYSYNKVMREGVWWRSFHAESAEAAVNQLRENIARSPNRRFTSYPSAYLGAITLEHLPTGQADTSPEA